MNNGYLMDIKKLEKCVYDNIGDYTFEEAYLKTKKILNIVVTSTQNWEIPPLLNYITAPNVLIRSAACLSTAIYGLYDNVDLLVKDKNKNIVLWRPLSFDHKKHTVKELEEPITRLSELFNVNHFIVSQAYPYTLPFLSRDIQMNQNSFTTKIQNFLYSEFRHRLFQLEQFKLLPKMLRGIIDQKFAGHVTLFPKVRLKDFYCLFSYPTKEILHYWVLVGERTTWPVLEFIKNRCRMEVKLDQINTSLKSQHPDETPHLDSVITSFSTMKRRTKSIH